MTLSIFLLFLFLEFNVPISRNEIEKDNLNSMTPVFTDASSAILLEKAELFQLLSKRVRLVLARSVFHEITAPGYPGAKSFAAAKNLGHIMVPSHTDVDHFDFGPTAEKFGSGEKETINLFLGKRDGFILIDDKKAARFCNTNQLPFINALLVPKIFWYSGFMTQKECLNKMNDLCRIGRYSEKIKTIAFDFTPADLSCFILEKKHVK